MCVLPVTSFDKSKRDTYIPPPYIHTQLPTPMYFRLIQHGVYVLLIPSCTNTRAPSDDIIHSKYVSTQNPPMTPTLQNITTTAHEIINQHQ